MIGSGYQPAIVWSMSPRQVKATRELVEKRRNRMRAEAVSDMQLATRGGKKEIEKALKRWLAH